METNKFPYNTDWKLHRRILMDENGNSDGNITADFKGIS
jgi:hypothetical protein